MPSRVLRHGLVDSEIVASLHDKTFRLWIHLLMAADDYGLVEIGFGPIRHACPMLDWNREIISKMLVELTDSGLIVPYEFDGKSYAAVQKWESRINCEAPKHPMPSFGMQHVRKVKGFKDSRVKSKASKILNHINDIDINSGPLVDNEGTHSDTKGYGVRGKGVECGGIDISKPKNKAQAPFVLPDWIPKEHWDAWIEARTKARKPITDYAKRLAVRKLDNYRERGHPPAQVLMKSAMNGWADLFEPKEI